MASTRAQALLAALAVGAATYEDDELVALVIHAAAPSPWPGQDVPDVLSTSQVVIAYDGGTVGAIPLEDALDLPEVELAELADALTLPVAGGWARVLEIDAAGIVWLGWEPLDEPPEEPVLLPQSTHAEA